MIPALTSLGRAAMLTERTEEGLSPLTGRERSRTPFTEGVISAPALEKGWQFGKGWGWGRQVLGGKSVAKSVKVTVKEVVVYR